MKMFQSFLCSGFLLLSALVSPAAALQNPSFESGLSGWIHDSNTYPIGTTTQPIGTEGSTVANMGTFDQTGSELRQDLALEKGAYLLRFFLGANSGNDLGRTATVKVVLSSGEDLIASKSFSVTSVGYPSFGLGFVFCELDFTVPLSALVSIKFLDVSADNGVSVDPMIDAIQLVSAGPPSPPSILIQPVGQTLGVGESTTLSVIAEGSGPLTYQWSHNGHPLLNETNSYMLVRTVDANDEGDYQVVVKSIDGETVSNIAHLTVFDGRNVIFNGSFEAGLANWNPDPAAYEIAAGVDGAKAANLGTFDQPFSAIFQDVSVVPGGRYRLSFASAANAVSVVGAISLLRVETTSSGGTTLLSETVQDISAGFPNGATGFTRRGFEFEVPMDVVGLTVSFRDVTPDGGRAVDQMIDAVKLQRVSPDQRLQLFIPSGSAELENSGSSAAFSVPIRFQQVYSSDNFPKTPITISEMRFRPDSALSFPFEGKLDHIKFTLSTTQKNPGQLSMRFEDNLTEDQTVVYEGPWGVFTSFTGSPSGPKSPDIILPLQRNFRYDPSRANLLVEIRNSGGLAVRFHHDGFATNSGVQRIFYDGNPDATVANSSDSSADVIQLSFVPDTSVPPVILQQPSSVTVLKGQDATLEVVASGSGPLGFQWSFEGVPIGGATNQTLSLTSVDENSSGFYSVQVANAFGSISSSQAFLWVQYPPTELALGDIHGDAGEVFELPIFVRRTGIERRIAFSVSFSTARLFFTSFELGAGLNSEGLVLNTNNVSGGLLGVELQLQGGDQISGGSNLLGNIRFRMAPGLVESLLAAVSFSGSPVPQEVVDSKSRRLLATYKSGSISIRFNGFESDVSPIGQPDTVLSVVDWVQTGRYVIGLDPIPNGMDFRKIDSAPRTTLGDGRLTASDWVQCGRYVEKSDPVVPVGGPEVFTSNPAEISHADAASDNVTVSIGDPIPSDYSGFAIPILINATGNESALTFSLGFDVTKFRYKDIDLTRYSESWKLLVNERDVALGRVGIGLAPRFGKKFGAGLTNEILRIRFRGAKGVEGNAFYFCDSPAPRSLSSSLGVDLKVSFGGNHVGAFGEDPILEYTDLGASIVLSWKTRTTTLVLESSETDLGGLQNWLPVVQVPSVIGDRAFITVQKPSKSGISLFRLRAP